MPRRKKVELTIAQKIEAVKGEIETLSAKLKEKKQELKKLESEQAEENKAGILDAFEASGKSADEVIAWLKGE